MGTIMSMFSVSEIKGRYLFIIDWLIDLWIYLLFIYLSILCIYLFIYFIYLLFSFDFMFCGLFKKKFKKGQNFKNVKVVYV